MASKMVNEKLEQAASLTALAEIVVRQAAPAVGARFSRFLAVGESMPDVAFLATLAARGVEERARRLLAADRSAFECRVDLEEARREQRRASTDLGGHLSAIRGLSQCARPRPPWGWLVSHDSPVPTSVADRLRCADRYLERLRHPRAVPFEDAGLRLYPEELAIDLEQKAGALRIAADAVEEKSGEAQQALDAKREAMAGFQADYGPARRLLESLTSLVEKRGWAGR